MSSMFSQSYHGEVFRALMEGLGELDMRCSSVPCKLLLTGADACPLVTGSNGEVLMAASSYGQGRIVVLSHETYLSKFPALVENALSWLGGRTKWGPAGPVVGVQKNLKAVAANIKESKYQVKVAEQFSKDLTVGVYVTDAYTVGESAGDMLAFIKAGGGVLIGGQAWHWASQNENENLILQFPGNKVTGVAGIYFSAHYSEGEKLPASPDIPASWKSLGYNFSVMQDLEFLLEGVSGFDIRGDCFASEALVHGPLAFPIGSTDDGKAFLAGTYFGRGRVILVTHDYFLQLKTLASFWTNAFRWLDQDRKGVIGFEPGIKILTDLDLTCENTKFREDLSVFVCETYSKTDPEIIQSFVAEGGGLLVAGHAWHWASTHPEKHHLRDFSGNKLLNKMGLSVLKGTVKKDFYKVPDPKESDKFHLRDFLYRFAAHAIENKVLSEQDMEQLKKLRAKCAAFLSMKAYESYSYLHILSILTHLLKTCALSKVSEQNPAKSPVEHLLLGLAHEVFNASLDQDGLLPYLIKDNAELPVISNQRIKITAHTADTMEWISTGLYLSPGMMTEMHFPQKLVKKWWKVQIGCQSDWLDAKELKRAPGVITKFRITSQVLKVGNLWGGLIYLLAPPNIRVDGEEVVVQKAVPVPYYKSGITRGEEWLSLREAPSPWAELEFHNIILTVPSRIVRTLQSVHEVEQLWNGIMKGVADLAVIKHKFTRKERIVADVQISAGWMHSGYPIMMRSSAAAELFDVDRAHTKGLWGETHELGHNQQRGCWEFPPHTTEATCNLWSVYVHEEVLGVQRATAARSLTPKKRNKCIKKYIDGGRKLSSWSVWTALETYLQLQERFGWDAFKKVFAAYHDMSIFPAGNEEKINLFAETFSQAVDMDLSAFFQAWGWPIMEDTKQKLSQLPQWTDHPLASYS